MSKYVKRGAFKKLILIYTYYYDRKSMFWKMKIEDWYEAIETFINDDILLWSREQ